MSGATWVAYTLYGYVAVGGVVGPLFVFLLAPRWVPGVRESGLLFRLFVLPGSVVLWPFIVAAVRRLREEAS